MIDITPELIVKLKTKVDLVELVREDTELVESRSKLYGICPFCGDREKLLMVSPENRIFGCYSCSAAGDIFSYIERKHNVDFRGAVRFLAKKYLIEQS